MVWDGGGRACAVVVVVVVVVVLTISCAFRFVFGGFWLGGPRLLIFVQTVAP